MSQVFNGWQHDLYADVPRQVDTLPTVDHLVGVLTSVMIETQSLPEADRQRMRNFFSACADLMMSRDRLKPADREIFERELRNAMARRGG